MELIRETLDNMTRYNNAAIEYANVSITPEAFYLRMYRAMREDENTGDPLDEGLEGITREMMRLNRLSKVYANRGSTIDRQTISPENQTKIQLGMVTVWTRMMNEHEHLIAYGNVVRDFYTILQDGETNNMASMKESIEDTFGTPYYEKLVEWVQNIAAPDFYRSYKDTDRAIRKVRYNAGMAFLTANIMSALKQPTSLAMYMSYSSPTELFASISRFLQSPNDFMNRIKELDPQVKEQQIDRFLEEIGKTIEAGALSQRQQNILKVLRAGSLPLRWMDMVVRTIGWDSVYNYEINNGATIEEAIDRASLATVQTQNSVSPKDVPSFLARNTNTAEFMNLLMAFQNQAVKTWGYMTHDIYGDIKTGRGNQAFLGIFAVLLQSYLLASLNAGKPPEDMEEFFEQVSVNTLGNMPILGTAIVQGYNGFTGGTVADTAINELLSAGRHAYRLANPRNDDENYGERMTKFTLSAYGAWSLFYGGMPVTIIKRMVRAFEEGNPLEIIGFRTANENTRVSRRASRRRERERQRRGMAALRMM
jgi:hypothetical protein